MTNIQGVLDWIKAKSNYVIAGIIGLLYLMFKFEQSRAVDATAKADQAEFKKDDAVAAQKQADIVNQIGVLQKQAEEEEKKKLTPEETAEALKKL